MTADDMGSAKLMARGQSSPPEEKCETRMDLTRCMTAFDIRLLQKTHLTHVSLDCNGLVELPGNFGQCLCNLEVLSLNGNELHSLPDSFQFLTKLAELYLAHNSLSSLPAFKYRCWTKLKVFDLSDNVLERLPYDFGEMEALERVYIEENQLKRIPPTIPLLSQLQILEASRNRLEKLPEFLGLLRNLRLLNLASNNLHCLPESLGELEFLECLEMSENCLKKLPTTFKSVHSLKKLYADRNSHLSCPSWLEDLSAVEEISVHSNNFRSAGENFGRNCKYLKKADFRGNFIYSLPESIGEASQLECLLLGNGREVGDEHEVIQSNPLNHLPDSFCQLSALTMLNFNENVLHLLPDEFGQLVNLKILHIERNLLSELPRTFSQLQSLELLSLAKNHLMLLPSDFGCLSRLRCLSLGGNLLQELPESFEQLKNLRSLDLCRNRLREIPLYLDQFDLVSFDYTKNPGSNSTSSGRVFKRVHPKVAGSWEKVAGVQDFDTAWTFLPRARHHIAGKLAKHEPMDADQEDEESKEEEEEEEEEEECWPDSYSETSETDLQNDEGQMAADFDEEKDSYVPHIEENWDLDTEYSKSQWDLLDNYEPLERVNMSSVVTDEHKVYRLIHRGDIQLYFPEQDHAPRIVRPSKATLQPEEGQFEDA